MHSSRMRTARSLTVSRHILRTHPWKQPCIPPGSNHACPPEQPCTPPQSNHACTPPGSNHTCPLGATTHAPWEQSHMSPLGATMHATPCPLGATMHATPCPPGATMHSPPEPPRMPPPLWTDRHLYKHNLRKLRCGR